MSKLRSLGVRVFMDDSVQRLEYLLLIAFPDEEHNIKESIDPILEEIGFENLILIHLEQKYRITFDEEGRKELRSIISWIERKNQAIKKNIIVNKIINH